jgi:hypothetical protein
MAPRQQTPRELGAGMRAGEMTELLRFRAEDYDPQARAAAGAAALLTMSQIARAQAYPTRPITMVVPFPAGGPVDTLGRILAEQMRGSLGQPILIENVSRAAGSIGVGRVARAAPDGYTLSIGQFGTHVVNGAIYALPYDTLADFQPVALLSSNPTLIVARKGVPPDDLTGLITWVESQSRQGIASHYWCGWHWTHWGIFLPERNRDSISVCTLSRCSASHARSSCGPNRHDD